MSERSDTAITTTTGALDLYRANTLTGDEAAWERGRAVVIFRRLCGFASTSYRSMAKELRARRSTLAEEAATYEAFPTSGDRVVGRSWSHHAKALRYARRIDVDNPAHEARLWLTRAELESVRDLVEAMRERIGGRSRKRTDWEWLARLMADRLHEYLEGRGDPAQSRIALSRLGIAS